MHFPLNVLAGQNTPRAVGSNGINHYQHHTCRCRHFLKAGPTSSYLPAPILARTQRGPTFRTANHASNGQSSISSSKSSARLPSCTQRSQASARCRDCLSSGRSPCAPESHATVFRGICQRAQVCHGTTNFRLEIGFPRWRWVRLR